MIHVQAAFFLSLWVFLLLFPICNFAFFVIIRVFFCYNARVKHMHVGIAEEKKVFHSQKNRLMTSKRKSPDSGGNCLAFQWAFLPATKFTMKSRSSPILIPPLPPTVPSIHWIFSCPLMTRRRTFGILPVLCAIHSWPADGWIGIQGWGSFRVHWSRNNARSGVLPPSPFGEARKLSEFFSVDFSTFEIILDLPESFKWSEQDAERINFGTVRLIFPIGLNWGWSAILPDVW